MVDILHHQIARRLGGDSYCETFMPEREDVARCVDVAVIHRAEMAASTHSHSKTGSTFRTAGRDEGAAGARLGCVGLVEFDENDNGLMALVLQHSFEMTRPHTACFWPSWF